MGHVALVLRFLVCSGFAAAVNLLIGQALYGVLHLSEGWYYAFSVSMGFMSGMGVSYALNRKFTFPPSGRARHDEIKAFFVVSIGGLILTTGLAQTLYVGAKPVLEWNSAILKVPINAETQAHMIAVVVTAVYSFIAHKNISFRAAREMTQRQDR